MNTDSPDEACVRRQEQDRAGLLVSEALDKVEDLLRYRLGRETIPYAVGCVADVRAEVRKDRHHPEHDSGWMDAKQQSPSRVPYTDAELCALRVDYSPRYRGVNSPEAVVIWTLLDMIEAQKGWKP